MTFRPLRDCVVVRPVEAEEKKVRVHDGTHATRAAVAKLETGNQDVKAAIESVLRTPEASIRQIAEPTRVFYPGRQDR